MPQVLIPFAAGLASPAERGRVLGTVMGGLLVGVLAARTVSGFVGTFDVGVRPVSNTRS